MSSDAADTRLREPPHDFAGEQTVLGSLLVNNAALDAVRDTLRSTTFADPEHRALFGAMCERIDRGEPANGITMRAWAEQAMPASGGGRYLAHLAAVSVHVIDLAASVRALDTVAMRRRMLAMGDQAAEWAQDESRDPAADVVVLAGELDAIAQAGGGGGGGFVALHRAASQAMTMAEKRYQSRSNLAGLSTGLEALDWRIGGLAPADLIVLAGRPSMGKTALATNIACDVARGGHVVGFVSLEMSAAQLALRIVAEQARVTATRLMRGHVNAGEFDRALVAGGEVEALPLFIDESAALTLPAMRSRARQLKRARGRLDLLVLDYLQLVDGSGGENRTQEITAITRGLKALAKELDVPVLALSQLSRDVEKRGGRPVLADLRDSGSIEQDADVVAFVFREEYYLANSNKPADKARALEVAGMAEVIVAKARNGPVGTCKLRFDPQAMRFTDPAAR